MHDSMLASATMGSEVLFQHLHAFTGTQFETMLAQGLFSPQTRVELLEGLIVDTTIHASQRQGLLIFLNEYLTQLLVGQPALLMVGGMLVLSEYARPFPDLAVLTFRQDYYKTRFPKAEDVLLLIEIESNQNLARKVKLPIYARHHIPQTWVLDPYTKTILNAYQSAITGYQMLEEQGGGMVSLRALGLTCDLAQLFS